MVEGSIQDQLSRLAFVFGSDRKAAEFIGVSHTQFSAWRSGAAPRDRGRARIADGASVVDRLRAHGLSEHELITELRSSWPDLNARPAELVAMGESAAVLQAIDAKYGRPSLLSAIEVAPDLVTALRTLAAAAAASAEALDQEVR